MKDIKFLILFILVAFVSSCSKEVPLNDVGEVQFFFKGDIDNVATSFEAGENNYFLNTYFQDEGPTDVLRMFGEFKEKSDSMADYLNFQFFGYDSVNNEFIFDNVFDDRDVFSFSGDSTSVTSGNLELKFDALNLPGSSHTWDFGDGSPAVTAATTNHTYLNPGPVNVTLSSSYQLTQCNESVTNTIDLANLQSCQVQFGVTPQSANFDSFLFRAPINFQTYDWQINGTSIPLTDSVINQMYNDSIRREVKLTATNTSCSSVWNAVITPTLNSACMAAFQFTVLQQPITTFSERPSFKTAIITYRKNGVVYSSFKNDGSDQSNRIVFSINSVSNYENNAAGQKTIRLNGSINTFLYNVNNLNDSIPIVSSQVSIAVAHP